MNAKPNQSVAMTKTNESLINMSGAVGAVAVSKKLSIGDALREIAIWCLCHYHNFDTERTCPARADLKCTCCQYCYQSCIDVVKRNA
jgi:hypothetical protein